MTTDTTGRSPRRAQLTVRGIKVTSLLPPAALQAAGLVPPEPAPAGDPVLDVELAWDGWADTGLSRFSASRGLDNLEGAGLVSAVRRPGRSPVVSVLDPEAGPGRSD